MKVKENTLWAVIIASLAFLVFLALRNITGFITLSNKASQSYAALIAFLIILVTAFYLTRLNKRKYK